MNPSSDRPGWTGGFTQALFGTYGVQPDGVKDKAQRVHEMRCDGVYCVEPRCEKGETWRIAHNYRVIEHDGVHKLKQDRAAYEASQRPKEPEREPETKPEPEPVTVMVPMTPMTPTDANNTGRVGTGESQDVDMGVELETFTPPVKRGKGKGGRPRRYATDAERKRAYRERRSRGA